MSKTLDGKHVAFLATDGVESVELSEPWAALEEAGAILSLVSIESGRIQGFDHLTPGKYFNVDQITSEAQAMDYDALVLPGGVASTDRLRTDDAAIDFVRAVVEDGLPVGIIGHGSWTLVNAGAASFRRIASWPSQRDEPSTTDAEWVDEEVVIDKSGPNVIVSSRASDDLPAFCKVLVKEFERPERSRPSDSGRDAK